MVRYLAAAVLIGLSSTAPAQSHRPYAGLERREIKALSTEQIADLRAGRGMGLALAAELNGYPGPLHVLELAEKLHLSPAQRATMQALFDAMRTEAIALGETVIALERKLDAAFATRSISAGSLAAMTSDIARSQGELRAAHLKYHLAALDVLQPEQVRRYAELRGYSGDGGHGHRRNH